MIRRPFSILRLLLVLAVIAAGAAWLYLQNGTAKVALATARPGPAIEAVYATGTVEPESWAKVGPLTVGRIAEMLVTEGERVTQGQKLARLDDREAAAKVAELEARAAYWREEMGRARTLADKGIKAREAEQKAASEYNQVTAAIAAARQRRADLVVAAPIDGVVLRRDFEPGEVVGTDSTLFWIGEARPLRITADVDEEDIARVMPGQKVLIKADAFPDAALTGRVDRLTPKGDPINKTFRVRVRLPDDTPVMIGMTAEINIITAEKTDALLIPAAAISADGTVWRVVDGRAQPQTARLGIRGRDRVEVLGGLNEGDSVIAAPPTGLKAGDRVKVE
ncbi:efflux RND transporter periplasmic adaptor subunit [Magnetospirillum moscoviense]|uniref:Efflux transporter periplasmic adaptor subunit n=1 Tax=Magnetospirillum moscoviense TaxID=1437059 RepID=A0A178M6V1_9PROT|nr:efflux RND transporter periplasmic adaptor subunit [Magnetospirillum moscoviense]MBF0326404.1 efflux RND transporter periplasmic adaptor subunit [Alphaproteobacteria bacterium]OAN44273.1 efflux transporter periplasmic adaptor subunit [Magnetospirillum moscoviense]